MEILIDGCGCEVGAIGSATYGFDASKMSDVESGSVGHSLKVSLPSSEVNRVIWGGDLGLHPQTKFNSERHRGEVVVDGIVMISGEARLCSVKGVGDDMVLEVEIVGDVSPWALSAIFGTFSSIGIDYSAILSQSEVERGWAESLGVVKFLPIERDSYEPEGSAVDMDGVRMIRSIDDYHPFLRVDDLVRAIIEPSGYSIVSEFMEGEEFRSLYMSGAYQSAQSSVASDRMGFYAKRLAQTTVLGDDIGRVSFSPYETICSVGNIVDVESVESDDECYVRGNSFVNLDGAIAFVPTTSVEVGFEYHLRYRTEYAIDTRDRLVGYNKLILADNQDVEWTLVNRFEDRRGGISPYFVYTLVAFDYEDGDRFYLKAVDTGEILLSFASRSCEVSMGDYGGELKLLVKHSDSTFYADYFGDWAMYDGYVAASGVTEVDVVVRSAPESVSPTNPKRFDLLLMGGAEAGMEFTLMTETSLRPYFASYPGYGSQIEFSDIAWHSGVSQADMLSALSHMYNLCFYSDVATKRLFVEPYAQMLDGSEWDWTQKIVDGKSMSFSDYALGMAKWQTWGYQRGDGQVNRLGSDEIFGDWNFDSDFYGAKDSSSTTLNTLFSPTLSSYEGVLIVGDRDDVELVDSLNFSPRIVRLFEGETTSDGVMPYAAFHAPDRGFTLCFEDRDGARGLNRFYEGQLLEGEHASLITLELRLTPYDMTSLLSPIEGAASLRSVFYFEISGERIKCRLERVESYSFGEDRACCTFLIID